MMHSNTNSTRKQFAVLEKRGGEMALDIFVLHKAWMPLDNSAPLYNDPEVAPPFHKRELNPV